MIALHDVHLRFRSTRPTSLRERIAQGLGRRRSTAGIAAPADADGSVHALRGVTLCIERGERVGVIGFNGAGKTTLLKTMCGIYTPTTGSVQVEGDVACLFELATGFEMEATGWDNMLTRGLLLGMTRREMREKRAEIAAFSELGAALERPVKTYSTGMAMRLAFAVSTAMSPDVLLLDEVIATGDIRFHEKARRRLAEMVGRASIVVLVSHSMPTIRELCSRVVWLEAGGVRCDGDAETVTAEYEAAFEPSEEEVSASEPSRAGLAGTPSREEGGR